jgi:hypothetical protein
MRKERAPVTQTIPFGRASGVTARQTFSNETITTPESRRAARNAPAFSGVAASDALRGPRRPDPGDKAPPRKPEPERKGAEDAHEEDELALWVLRHPLGRARHQGL